MKSLFKLDFASRVVLITYFIYSILFLIKDPNLFGIDYALSCLLGLASIILLFRIAALATAFSSNLRFLSLLGLSILYALGMAYKYRTGSNFDFAVCMDNIDELIYFESASVVLGTFNFFDILFLLSFTLFLLLSQIIWKKLSVVEKSPLAIIQLLVAMGLYGAIVVGPFTANDSLTSIIKSAVDYFNYPKDGELSYKYKQIERSHQYPYLQEVAKLGPKVKPNIILISIESFNANFIDKKNPEGKYITPFFNSLIDRGYFIENFYSSSVQTGKGHFTTLCSLLPLSQGKVFARYDDNSFYCLPEILQDFGYSTIFFQANERANFDNSYTFLSRNGIDQFVTPDLKVYQPAFLKQIKWGWGLQDNYIYQQALSRMDLMLEQKKPVFMMVATISNHMRFDSIPKEQQILYPNNPIDPKKRYLNSLRLVDQYLKEFFFELKKRPYYKDSIVIVTSDHSFPAGEHENYYPETHSYQESFQIPLLILWPDKLPAYREKTRAFSQLDIAPTILDILGIEVKNHFQGSSIFKTEKGSMQYMVQPYDGVHLVIIDFPHKYTFHVGSGRESLFDLSLDALETNNLAKESRYKQQILRMRQERSKFWLNDLLIGSNRIFPSQ